MRLIASLLAALTFGLLSAAPVSAQSGCTYLAHGAVLTAAQWNFCFTQKQDGLGYTPVNKAGDTLLGRLTTTPSTTLTAGFNIAPGVGPTSPNNGDVWTSNAGMFVRINGSTVGPLGTGGGGGGLSPTLASGQLFVGNASNLATGVALSGDATITNAGVITVTKTNGTNLGTMAVQNASAVAITGGTVTGLPSPSVTADAATKGYVDATASGLNPLAASNLATAAALPTNTYANGTAGVGATLTANANGALTVDGVATTNGMFILVKNEVAAANNGIYVVTDLGSGGTPYILTRATYFDTASEMLKGSYSFISAGTANTGRSYVLNPAVTTVGTDPVTWQLFSSQTLSLAQNKIYIGDASNLAVASTATYPASTTINQILYSSAANVITGLATANGGLLNTSATGVPSVTAAPVLGVNGTTQGTLGLRGSTSGTVTLSTAAVAGTLTIKLPIADGTANQVLKTDGAGQWGWASGGTVTSVALSLPSILTVSGSPVTTSGTLTAVLATQTANTGFFGPTTGSAAAPTFRAMVTADLPALIQKTELVSCDITGAVDCSSAINTALATCGTNKGGTVQIPAGLILVNAGITVPTTASSCIINGTGTFQEFTGTFGSQTPPTSGTTLYQTSSVNCSITGGGSGLNNFGIQNLIFRQSQPADTGGWTPVGYQPVICLAGPSQADIHNIMLYGVFQGIKIGDAPTNSSAGRVRMRNIFGACFSSCVNISFAADVVWLDSFEFYANYLIGTNIISYMQANASAITLTRADGPYLSNIFVLGAQNGLVTNQGNGTMSGTQDSSDIKMDNFRVETVKNGLLVQGCSDFHGTNWFISGQAAAGGSIAGSVGINVPGSSNSGTPPTVPFHTACSATSGVHFIDVANLYINNVGTYCVASNVYDISFVNARCNTYSQDSSGTYVAFIANAGAYIRLTGRAQAVNGLGSPALSGGAGTVSTTFAYTTP